MNRRQFKFLLLALSTVVVFVVLSVRVRGINEDIHNQYRSDLRQLGGLHAVLNDNVLRAKLGLLMYYDPLNETLNTIGQARNQLGQVPYFISEEGQREIRQSLKAYDILLIQQRGLVERFKTENAVLINSLSYFTIVVSDVTSNTATADIDPTVKETLNRLFQDILLYNTTANKALLPRIEQHIDVLRLNRDKLNFASSSNSVDLDVLVSHADIVGQRKPVIDSVLDEMFALPISARISELSNLYDVYYAAARQNTSFYQVALYVFSLVVVGYISASIIGRLRKSAATVSKAKEELQLTYADLEQRSGQLETANTELQKATREAREASRLKDEFLAVMSHELRTPLNAIIGFQGILLMNGKLDERPTHMIQRAQANARRLLALINDILDISRIEAGRLQLAPVDLPIAQTVELWRSQMSVLADEKGLEFSVNVADTVPATIHIDEDAITKVVTNLLGNAFKFTEKGKVALDLERSNGNWTIKVSDTGIGISAHMQQVIFERFRQVDGSTTRKYGGSGLGLAIVYNLCKAMNGTVTVHSLPEKGSTFTVTLPLDTAPEERRTYGPQS